MQRTATRLLALLAAMAVVAVGVIWGAARASAAENPNISFSNVRVQKLDAGGNPVLPSDTSQLTVEDQARLSFSWALKQGSPLAEGDSFSVTLPPQLRAAVTSAGGLGSVPLQVDHSPKDGTAETTIASCIVTQFKVECTFNAKAQELVAGGWDNISGNATVKLSAVQATTSEALPFEFSGPTGVVQADLPGTGGIKAKVVNPFNFNPVQFAKGSTGIGSASTAVDYNVPLGFGAYGKSLGQHLKDANDTRVFDGVQVHTVTFTDYLGSGQRFFGPANWKLFLESTRADGPRKQLLDSGEPGATETAGLGSFELRVEMDEADADGQVARISITGPFSADANYGLTYSACSLDATTCDVPDRRSLPKLKPGFNYENRILADGTQANASITRSFTAAFTSEVTMSLNYGTFSVTKFVAGPGSALVKEGAPFTVEATYTLPGRADTTYPGWVAPGVLNADQTTGKLTLQAQVAKTVTFYGPSAPVTFPAGTRVVLSEQVHPASAPAGYQWESYKFEVPGSSNNEFVIQNQAITPVKLTNRLEPLPKYPFVMKKTLVGAPAAAQGHNFTFTYTCDDGQRGSETVPGDGSSVESAKRFLPGTVCTVEEDQTTAQFDGYNLTAPSPVQVTVAAGTPAEASLTNTYVQKTGTFKVVKTVSGAPASAAEKDFRFSYACEHAGAPVKNGVLTVKGNGVAVPAAETLPVGTVCTVTEDAASAQIAGYSLAAVASQQVTIAETEVAELAFANAYTRDAGSFEVSKQVDGNGADLAAAKEFTFAYTCTDAAGAQTQGTFKLAGNETRLVDDVAAGQCSLTETGAEVANTDLATSFEVGGTKTDGATVQFAVVKGAKTAVAAKNTYTAHVGTFSVAKTVTGVEPADKDFVFNYTCGAESGSITAKGDGVAVPANKSFRVGTSCTITEDAQGAVIGGYNLSAPAPQTITIGKDTTAAVSFVNAYARKVGTFQVAKTVSGAPADAAAKDYTFNYTCGTESGTLVAKGDGVAVPAGKNFPAGTSCTITEDADKAAIAGYSLTAPAAQSLEIVEGSTGTMLTFANTYSRDLGGFVVSKAVDGTGSDLAKGKSFSFSYVCTGVDGTETKADFTLLAGADMRVSDVPVGKCTLTESDAAIVNTDLATAFSVDGTVTDGAKVEFDVVKGASLNVTATNTYTAHMSTFAVAKSVTGAPADAAAKEFKFNWTCGEESGVLVAKGDGVAVPVGKDFRVGTSCTVSEDGQSAQLDGFNLAKPADQKIVLPAKGETATVAFENAYTKVVAPSAKPSTTPSAPAKDKAKDKGKGGKLAKTGSDAIVVGSVAGALLIGGAVVLLLRRRKGQ